jgi:hypothetical protein
MQEAISDALFKSVSNHIGLSKTRSETLAWLAYLFMRQGTICLWRLAAYVSTEARTESVRRRFYRFFQFVRLDGTMMAKIVADLLGLRGKPWALVMDRTNWDFGRTTINILMVSVIWNGVGIPLIWVVLPKAGNSGMEERTELLDRLLQVFPDLRVASLMGDREFIGNGFMADLHRRNIPFILRLRENQHVVRDGRRMTTIARMAGSLRKKEKLVVREGVRLGLKADGDSPVVRLVIMRLKTGEILALACSENPESALGEYRRRWTIETLFANLKTKGFNMEDTRITDRDKLSTLLAVLSLAVALAVKTGVAAARLKPIPVKKHGRKAWSLFALGLACLRKIFATASPAQIRNFLRELLSARQTVKPLMLLRL